MNSTNDQHVLLRLLDPIRRRIALLLRRCVIDEVKDENPIQVMKLKLFKGEVRKGVERMQQYGVSSVPLKDCQALAACVDGECGHEIVILAEDRRYRPRKQKPGSVMIYSNANRKGDADTEHHIFFDPDSRMVRIRAQYLFIDADENITLKAKNNIKLEAGNDIDVKAGGNLLQCGAQSSYMQNPQPACNTDTGECCYTCTSCGKKNPCSTCSGCGGSCTKDDEEEEENAGCL